MNTGMEIGWLPEVALGTKSEGVGFLLQVD